MKKFIVALFVCIATAMVANAQAVQYEQGYDFITKSPAQKVVVDYFWSSDTGRWNVYSWNNFGVNYNSLIPGSTDATALLYVERQIGNSNFYVHPEVRLNTWCENYYQLGFAYLLPFKDLGIYLTPKYSYHGRHDFQFSINSSYESEHFYHDGYIDTDWVPASSLPGFQPAYGVGFWGEEKFCYKFNDLFSLGAKLLFGGDTQSGFCILAPMVVARVSLY